MALFVTSTGTDQGKTYVTRLLCKQLDGAYAIKPVISGYEASEQSDTALIIAASGRGLSVEECSPWRFKEPVSPDLSAELEEKTIDYESLLKFCSNREVDIIEGAGGIMSPLTSTHTNLDLITDTKSEVLLVSGLYLGCISHILTALSVLEQKNLVVKGVVLSAITANSLPFKTVIASLAPQLSASISIFSLEYSPDFNQNWRKQPDLTSVSLSK